MNEQCRVYTVDSWVTPLERFLNHQSKQGWEFVSFTPAGHALFRNVNWGREIQPSRGEILEEKR